MKNHEKNEYGIEYALQETELEILKVVDKFCREHQICYSLYAGTLLGAVRHQGFIPWDDDIDICMSREYYNKFIEEWTKNPVDGYILQNRENSPLFNQSFTKIRKDHTCFLQENDIIGRYHHGIFIDIFPLDRIPKKILKVFYILRCIFYQIYIKGYIPKDKNILFRCLGKIFLSSSEEIRNRKIKNLFIKLTKYNLNVNYELISSDSVIELFNQILPNDMLEEYTYLKFEDSEFMCSKKYDKCLRKLFGNYWTFPPESERKACHQPIKIDYEHNYEEFT